MVCDLSIFIHAFLFLATQMSQVTSSFMVAVDSSSHAIGLVKNVLVHRRRYSFQLYVFVVHSCHLAVAKFLFDGARGRYKLTVAGA